MNHLPPRVFAVHQPTGRDNQGNIRDTMDLSPAAVWGELIFVLREDENPFADIDATLEKVRDVMDDEGFNETDWLLLVGNPILIGVVSSVAVEITGQLRVLQWNRGAKEYAPVEVQFSEEAEA